MSDHVSHECGVALVRLLKPLSYYEQKYGSPLWGFTKLFLLMEKQHNRGQDGAGVACVKLDMPAGEPFMFRERNVKANPLDKIFRQLLAQYNDHVAAGLIHPEFPDTVKKNFDFGGELLMGHLRYGTSGGYNISSLSSVFPPQPVADPQPRAVRQFQPHQHARAEPLADRDGAAPDLRDGHAGDPRENRVLPR
jgi:amidophosphoribosyltransferase